MRFPTQALIAATVATTLATGQPSTVLADQAPMSADQKREQTRLNNAKRASQTRKQAATWQAYAERCETAFAAGDQIPEKDLRITDPMGIDADLLGMSSEEISEQYGLASDAFYASRVAINECERKYLKKRNDGS